MRSRALIPRALRTIRQHRLLTSGDRVVVALSGGPDSVALSWALHDLAPRLGVEVAGLVHVHHGLRGEAADADQAFCRDMASTMGVPFQACRVDTRAEMDRAHVSVETAARRLRYHALAEAAVALGANAIATGHTLDDQAETVLMRLLRGAGSRGVSGVRVRRGAVIRPLLDCRRADVLVYLSACGVACRHDASNDDRSIPRNRLRHELMPVVAAVAPRGVDALARFAMLAADDEQYLMAEAISAASSCVLMSETGVQLECGALTSLAPAIARRIVRLSLERAAPARRWSVRAIDAVVGMAGGAGSARLDLPGVWLERRGGRLVLAAGVPPSPPMFEAALEVPGAVTVPAAGLEIGARFAHGVDGPFEAATGLRVVCQAEAVQLPLRVRNRRPGDQMKPLGAPGRRKLQDVFVDRKIPRWARAHVPVVEDASGRIIWVVGVAVAEAVRVTAPDASVIILTARPL